jgi:dGTPase
MLNWEKLLSAKRLGQEDREYTDRHLERTQYQRDYDRIIFSSPFRRLQNKTQVFPLPGSVFVHNRLTHSLEVASVGRSLGNMVAWEVQRKYPDLRTDLIGEIGTIVSTACLCHDLGNPPFGHSGEKAISEYFENGEGMSLQNEFSKQQWEDLVSFEGNANALRLLTYRFNGRREGGYALTYATLASLIKYPWDSLNKTPKGKYGYFYSENEAYEKVVNEAGLKLEVHGEYKVVRHPLVYLMEAADDISYLVMDMEDAHKLGIVTTEKTKSILLNFFENDTKVMQRLLEVMKEVSDTNEQIAYLRAMVINKMVQGVVQVFMENYMLIMTGEFTGSLVDYFDDDVEDALQECRAFSKEKIYSHRSVREIELAGYNILGGLMKDFVNAVKNPDTHYNKSLLAMVPEQYPVRSEDMYTRVRGVLDFVSGMTDVYALDLFRKIRGISFDAYV